MTAFPDHYAALGIDPTADQEVIGAAYRALAKKYHPDTGATAGTASPERFAEIQQAYDVLGSPETRKRYDLELLDATQRELDEHLARKQRKIAGATGAAPPPPPPPDLGDIRPEPRRDKPPSSRPVAGTRKMGPFLVVAGLLMVVAGGLASLYLSYTPLPPVEEPPLPPVAHELTASPVPEKADTPAAAPKAQTQQAALPEQPAAVAAVPEQPPLFGTSLLDEPAPEASLPLREDADAELPPAPLPKAKPQTVQTEARAQRFTVVIYEKYRSGDTIEEDGGVVFASEGRCAAFGERAVLRRLAPFEGQRQRPRIWYECVQAP
jgi:DnaJ-domain-containing protein 1